jgi:serine/threonine protein phosphatase PrpC
MSRFALIVFDGCNGDQNRGVISDEKAVETLVNEGKRTEEELEECEDGSEVIIDVEGDQHKRLRKL